MERGLDLALDARAASGVGGVPDEGATLGEQLGERDDVEERGRDEVEKSTPLVAPKGGAKSPKQQLASRSEELA